MESYEMQLAYARILKDCYEAGDFDSLAEHLAEDAVYESQWVIEPWVGKAAVLGHYREIAEAAKKNGQAMHAQVVLLKRQSRSAPVMLWYDEGAPCVAVQQGDAAEIKIIVTLKLNEAGLIQRIDICMPQFFEWEVATAGTRGQKCRKIEVD